MPITIQTGSIKYRKENGEYKGINAVTTEEQIESIESAAQEQIALVQSAAETAGEAQIDLIEQAGEDTIDSIPEDYTELAEEVDGIKSELDNVNKLTFDFLTGATWEIGTINDTTGADSYSSSMFRTGYISLSGINSLSVAITSGYKFLVALINSDKTSVVNTLSWNTIDKSFDLSDYPTASFVRFLLQKTDNTLPDATSYIQVIYTNPFSEFVSKALQSGDDLESALYANDRLENRLSFDASGTFSNAKMSVTVGNGIISIDDNNFGASVYLEMKNPISQISGWSSATKYLTLLAGHTYKLRTIPVSGTFTGIGNAIRCTICSGEASADYSAKAEGEDVTFSYNSDTTVSIVLYISYGTTADIVFQYALEDISEIVALDNRNQVNAISNQVDVLGYDITKINNLNNDLMVGESFEVGGIDLTTGANITASNMYRTGYLSLDGINKLSIVIDTGYKFLVAFINSDKTDVVNDNPTYKTTSQVYDISDYPTAKFVRVLYQKTDNTLPASTDYIAITYETNLLERLKNTVQRGEVSYKTLAQDLKATLTVKYSDTPETLTYPNTNSLLRVDGSLVSYTGAYAVTDYIDCSGWYGLKFSGRQYYDGQCLAFYDSHHDYIADSSFPGSTSGTHNYTNQIITIPQNAKYVRFAQYGSTVITYVYPSTEYIPSHIGAKWSGKKWVCIGDSLTEVNSTATKKYHDYIVDYTGITVVNLGVGGTGYMNGGSGSNPFRNRIALIPSDADVITIFGSFNDLGDTRPLGTKTDTGTSTIGGCINTTFDALFDAIPLANVGVISPTPWGSAYPLDNVDGAQYKYVDLLKEICVRRGIPFLDLFHESLLRPWDATFISEAYSNDSTGVHPDENGHKLIAPRFEGFLDSLLFV